MTRIIALLITVFSAKAAFSQAVEYRLAPSGRFQLAESKDGKVEEQKATVVISQDGRLNINKLPGSAMVPHQNLLRGMLIASDPNGVTTITLSVPDGTTRKLLQLPEDSGLVVEAILKEEDKERLGLAVGDIILKVNDKAATSEEVVKEELKADNIRIRIVRKGEEKDLTPKPGKKQTTKRYLLGIRLGELEPVVRTQLGLDEYVSVVVQDVTDDSAAKEGGIQVNDILLTINSKEATGAEMVQKAVQDSKGEPVELKVLRDGEELTVKVTPKLVETPLETALLEIEGDFTADWNQIYQLPNSRATAPLYWYHAPGQMGVIQTPKKLNEIETKLDELKAAIEELKALHEKN